MKICIPVLKDDGLKSEVSEHFGSAPIFLIVDTESKDCKAIKNTNEHHSHGMCQPLAVVAGEDFGGIVVGGIGMGALNKLKAAGKKVMKTSEKDVESLLKAYEAGNIEEVDAKGACQNHSCH